MIFIMLIAVVKILLRKARGQFECEMLSVESGVWMQWLLLLVIIVSVRCQQVPMECMDRSPDM